MADGKAGKGKGGKGDKILKRQAEEMTKQLRRSVAMHEMKERREWEEEEIDWEVESEERVQICYGGGKEVVGEWIEDL